MYAFDRGPPSEDGEVLANPDRRISPQVPPPRASLFFLPLLSPVWCVGPSFARLLGRPKGSSLFRVACARVDASQENTLVAFRGDSYHRVKGCVQHTAPQHAAAAGRRDRSRRRGLARSTRTAPGTRRARSTCACRSWWRSTGSLAGCTGSRRGLRSKSGACRWSRVGGSTGSRDEGDDSGGRRSGRACAAPRAAHTVHARRQRGRVPARIGRARGEKRIFIINALGRATPAPAPALHFPYPCPYGRRQRRA